MCRRDGGRRKNREPRAETRDQLKPKNYTRRTGPVLIPAKQQEVKDKRRKQSRRSGEEAESSDDASTTAASSIVRPLFGMEGDFLVSCRACWEAWAAGHLFLVVLPDLSYKGAEGLIYVDALLSRGLDELASEVLRKVTTLIHPDLPLILQVALVSDDDDGEEVLILYSQDLLVEGADFLEGVAGCDGVHEKEALARAHVLLSHGAILLLTSSI